LVLNVVFSKLVPNPRCVLNLKLLASTVAEISIGSHFLDTPLAQTPANFGTKRRFFGKLVPNPISVPNLKLLASTVAEISRGSQIFFGCSLAQTPANFGTKRGFLVS